MIWWRLSYKLYDCRLRSASISSYDASAKKLSEGWRTSCLCGYRIGYRFTAWCNSCSPAYPSHHPLYSLTQGCFLE
jgi:hypothetical protein